VESGSNPSSFKIKNTAEPNMAKHTIKYKAPKPIMIFSAKLVAKDAERKKDFHSNLMKCLNIVNGLNF
jgi:hypothetical protein